MLIQKGRPAIVLAPMEGITDSPMRALLTEVGFFSYSVSEFLRVSATPIPAKVLAKEIPEWKNNWRTPQGITVVPQFLGGHPERIALSAKIAVEKLAAPAVDLNFGCPAPTVNRHDGGATLLKYPDRLQEIVATVRAALPEHIPVSAKLRLGWEDSRDIFQNAEAAARGGASWITIHARTKMRGYAPPVDWEKIGEAKKNLDIPIIANGDIWTREDFLRCREITGSEHFMLGRGVVVNPALSWQVAFELGLVKEIPQIPNWYELVKNFTQKCSLANKNPTYPIDRTKQWLKLSSSRKTFLGFDQIKTAENLSDLLQELRRLVVGHHLHS